MFRTPWNEHKEQKDIAMKKIILYCAALFIFQNSILFAQEVQETPASKLIMKTPAYAKHPFQLFDGTPLGYNDIHTLTLEVPGNDKIIKQAKPWRTVSIIMMGASGVSCFFQLYTLVFRNTFDDPIFYGRMAYMTTFLALGGSALAGMIYHDKIQKAVYNYNLYIMGMPVN
jgi:hypothetical protein